MLDVGSWKYEIRSTKYKVQRKKSIDCCAVRG